MTAVTPPTIRDHRCGERKAHADHFPRRTLSLLLLQPRAEPPHVHVDRDTFSLKVPLEPLAFAKGKGFRGHEINAILGLVELNRDRLLEAWHEYFG